MNVMAFVFLMILAAGASAADPETTTVTPLTTETGTGGGSVFFDTDPDGATIWVDNNQIGTSDLTYFSGKTGTLNVFIQRKGYEDYTGTVTVIEGRKVEFFAKLTQLTRTLPTEEIPFVPVVIATTIRKSTMTVPTPWPETTQASLDPAVVVGAAALGAVILAIRRR